MTHMTYDPLARCELRSDLELLLIVEPEPEPESRSEHTHNERLWVIKDEPVIFGMLLAEQQILESVARRQRQHDNGFDLVIWYHGIVDVVDHADGNRMLATQSVR